MSKQVSITTHENKMEFLLATLEAAEKRRNAAENKSSILLASNAILLSAIIGLGLPILNYQNPSAVLVIFTSIALISVILSILFCAEVLFPVITYKQRKKVMDLGKDNDEHNLFLSISIANFKKSDYQQEIHQLTEFEIIQQLSSQVHNLSRLVKERYKTLRIAHTAFVVGAIAFAMLALVKMYLP